MKKIILLMLLPLQCFAFGNLFIIGGGSQSDELVKEYLKLCGASNKLLIVAKASSLEEEVLAEVQTRFQTLGATNTHKYICQAQADQCLEQLSDVKCVYFSGGDQKKLTEHFLGSKAIEKLHQIFADGGTMIGTSAGAAIMSEVMLSGNILDDAEGFSRIAVNHVEDSIGFGFLKNFIIDQHFVKRQRQNRLLSKVLELPYLVGVGIDESTAIVFKNTITEFTVTGQASVVIFDARQTSPGLDGRGNFSVKNLSQSILSSDQTFKF
ncbi:MAG: cyanophycinase [Bdellovibrionales bacterium CG12_big_fil_rev_8_21_14_0_65_38_15]|nr:MAG: cyanophycinase [Bdellovibrionales bacterium CG22_combo_CG10-13_8_21_14_all_38_13]PIQ57209.1 MAG: cyanophycinase [Bdellovibrionales bacterium CG12_big_fil_rev_8_21_14_0_65_38_15]PIR31403.1 MAG: cyanophycinase [Bdellovibrionales bacterium CG11_big_fil_rev_8_21_14_0_20_38_13]